MARDRTRRGPTPAAGGSASRPQHGFRVTSLALLPGSPPSCSFSGDPEVTGKVTQRRAGRGGAAVPRRGKFVGSSGVSAAQGAVSPVAVFESWGREALGVNEIAEAGVGTEIEKRAGFQAESPHALCLHSGR